MAEDNGRGGKKVFRSPNHPAFDLAEAIGKAKIIFDAEKRSGTTADVIVKHLGYSHTNGPGGRALSGLRQFGLLDQSGGQYRISDLAFHILHFPEGSAEKREAIKAAALRPNLYREIREQYSDTLPSDDTLRSVLLRRGFNPSVLDDVIKDFRSTMSLAGDANVSYTDSTEGNKMVNQTPEPVTMGKTPIGIQTYSFALSPDAKAELSLKGTITADDLDLLRDHIELTIKALARKSKTA